MNKRQPTIDEMIATERREATIALRHLAGESIDTEPLWMRGTNGQHIITYAGAVNLAELFGIERVSERTKQTPRNGMPATFATVTVKCGSNTRMGAAVSRHPQVACELAFRNGVKQIVMGMSTGAHGKRQIARIGRIDRSPCGERRWEQAKQSADRIASLVPDQEDGEGIIPQPSLDSSRRGQAMTRRWSGWGQVTGGAEIPFKLIS